MPLHPDLSEEDVDFVVAQLRSEIELLLRFYTPADKRKSFFDLFRIESVADYVESIDSLEIDLDSLAATRTVHPDYEFIENYLSILMRNASRVVFLGVYDFSKEAYFVNRYPEKLFVAGDVSAKAIQLAGKALYKCTCD